MLPPWRRSGALPGKAAPSMPSRDPLKTSSAHAAALYAFTPQGLRVALRVANALGCPGELFVPEALLAEGIAPGASGTAPQPIITRFSSLQTVMAENFSRYSVHIFVGATGIAVRSIAPHVRTKATDPAVLVVDQKAQFVISLLSGHLGGANTWTAKVADILGATPVITTATDLEGLPALDLLAQECGLVPADPDSLEGFKVVSAALLAGRPVRLWDPENRLGLAGSPYIVPDSGQSVSQGLVQDSGQGSKEDSGAGLESGSDGKWLAGGKDAQQRSDSPLVVVSERSAVCFPPDALVLHPKDLFAGIGCRRGTSAVAIEHALREAYACAGLALAATVTLASVDAKEDELGLIEAARRLGLPVSFFAKGVLALLPVTKPSAKAQERFGIQGVCEPAALAAAGGHHDAASHKVGLYLHKAELVLPKFTLDGVTVAVALRRNT